MCLHLPFNVNFITFVFDWWCDCANYVSQKVKTIRFVDISISTNHLSVIQVNRHGYTALQSQKVAATYRKSKLLLPFGPTTESQQTPQKTRWPNAALMLIRASTTLGQH